MPDHKAKAEKRKYTTYPIGPLSYSRTVQALREVFDELVPLFQSTFQWEHFLKYGVDKHFIGRKVDLTGTESLATPSDIWAQTGYTDQGANIFEGTFTLPATLSRVAVYSFRAYRYPQLTAYIRLPVLGPTGGNETQQTFYFGLEHGAAVFNGLYCFELVRGGFFGDDNVLRAYAGPLTLSREVNINVKKPADSTTVYHVYRILYGKNLIQFRIDAEIACLAVPCGVGDSVIIKQNVQPYSLILVPSAPSGITPFIENYTNRTLPGVAPTVFNISPYRFRFSEGNEVESLNLPLYVEDTAALFQGSVVAAGSLTSHPFPLFGYSMKTISLLLNQASTVVIQAYTRTGTWRQYDSFPLAANTFKSYVMEGNPVLGRVVITPTTYPATVQEGEVALA